MAPRIVIDKNLEMLTSSEVAQLFGVNPKTVTRWAVAGRIVYIRTPGGDRRYPAAAVQALLDSCD